MSVRNALKIFLSITIAVAVFMVIGEVLIRLYLHYNTLYDVEMARYAMYMKTESDNPLIGHVHKPNVAMRLMDSVVEINSDGLRDKEYPVARNESQRIAVLGDSLTFGWGVEREDSFVTLLEEALNETDPTEMINFGAGNYNTEQEVNLFLEKGLKYKPDKVVLFYFINDAEVSPRKSKLWFLGYSNLITFYWSRVNSLVSKHVSAKNWQEYYSSLYVDGQEGWEDSKKAFLQLRDVCQREGVQVQILLLPELHDVKNEAFRDIYDSVSRFLETNGIDHLNLATLFKDQEKPRALWVRYDDAHPNKLAHKVIAEASWNFISEKEPQ